MLFNRIFILLFCTTALINSFAQKITAAEYFFDKDPGTGKGKLLSAGTAAASVHFVASLSTTSLPTGFHSLNIRARNTVGNWSLPETRSFYVSSKSVSTLSKITASEYFFDKDPGFGKGKTLTISTADTLVHFVAKLPASGLGTGFHTLAIHVKNANLQWSLLEGRSFYVSKSVADTLSNITNAEYFFDADPGAGKGASLSVGKAGTTVHFVVSLPAASLKTGFHSLNIRVGTSSGSWSLLESRSFYVSSKSVSTLSKITASEYFFDKDPGFGKGKPLTISTADTLVHFVATFPAKGLGTGFHTLAIRVKNANRQWSLPESRSFYVSKSVADTLSNITNAEYFFDADPGAGKGTSLSVGKAGTTVHFVVSLPTTSLKPGFHALNIRAGTSSGNWSLFESRSFYVSQNTVAPLAKIIGAEYYFDRDPGYGKGKALSMGTSDTAVHFVVSIPATTILPFIGKNHVLVIRVKNSDGRWSLYETSSFAFLPTDKDRDGLVDYDEPPVGTNYLIFNTNGDGLADGVNVFTGLSATSKDTDGDGISNLQEVLHGSSPVLKDTDGDGEPDNTDDFPLDRFRKKKPPQNLSDHIAPTITLLEPF